MANFTGTSGSEEFAGDEFSNNLFSDLAPLLTLFGEQVTKQFLSMRARESQSDAEQELLSSTSNDVCELWSGHEVVRVMCQPAGMKTLIISDKKVYDLKSAIWSSILERINIADEDLDSLTDAAPNLTLNVQNATAGPRELWTWAAIGTILQLVAIVIPGIATYVWQWPKADVKVQSYGYPCFVIGTLLVVLGTMVCGHVIEGVTDEHNFTMRPLADFDLRRGRDPQDKMQVVRLQRACTVSDQHFSSYAIFNDEDNHSIRTSRLNTSDYGTLAAVSSLVSIVGFIIQFVGLRALHWSATIIQLGITIIMTGIRAWARRGLAFDPKTHVIPDGHEIAWLVLHLVSKNRESRRPISEDVLKNQGAPNNQDAFKQVVPKNQGVPRSTDTQAFDIEDELAPLSNSGRSSWNKRRSTVRGFWNIDCDENFQSAKEFLWEPIVGYNSYHHGGIYPLSSDADNASEAAAKIEISRKGFREELYMFQQLFSPLRFDGDIGVELTDQPTSDDLKDDTLNLYKQIAEVMPADNTVINMARSLTSVMERIMDILCDVNAVDWKKEGIAIKQIDAENDIPGLDRPGDKVSKVFWGFTISMRMPYEHQAQTNRLCFCMARVVDGPIRWRLQDPELIVGVLSLWLYAMARRRISIEKFGESMIKLRRESAVQFGKIGRIIGTGARNGPEELLSFWLGVPVNPISLPDGSNTLLRDDIRQEATWFLGMLLSSMAQASTDPKKSDQDASSQMHHNLSVQTRDDSSLELNFAQELLSLFILAMANNIGKVKGKTVFDERRYNMARELGQPAICLENSVFNAIANEVVNGGLAHDTREAYSLIIPAFCKLGILPKPEDTEEFS